MKKNITINLFGTLYNIDDDAYQLLDSYLKSMKRYFGTQEGGEEIADDIEHRVAELLWEKKEQGIEAISLDIIKEIIGKIGNAEEIAGNETMTEEDSTQRSTSDYSYEDDNFDASTATMWQRLRHHFSNRRLFRDPDNQLLGGVCSGMAHYIGFGDPVLWRLLLVVLFLLKGFGLLAYLLMWLIVPLARTPEDKLRMKGVNLNPNNINEQILRDHKNSECGTGNGNTGSGCLKLIFAFLILGPLGFIIFFIFMFAIVSFGIIGGIGSAIISSSDFFPINTLIESNGIMVVVGLACILVVLAIVFFLLLRLIFGSGKPMNKVTRIVIGIVLGSCLTFAVYTTAQTITRFITLDNEVHKKQYTMRTGQVSSNTFKPQPLLDLPYLDESGFQIITNTCNRCTWSGDYPTGNANKRYLDACDYDFLKFTAEKTDTVEPGTYTLTALVRAEDNGAYLYVNVGETQNLQHIPPYGNENGNLWKWACGSLSLPEVKKFYPELSNDSIRQLIAQTNEGDGFGWQLMCIEGIKVKEKGQTVSYGITTDPDITYDTPMCDWVSATDFKLTRTDRQ